ncbi:MAG: hypothetical protein DI577_07945, partial [Microbacterium sp.]
MNWWSLAILAYTS